MIKLKQAIIVEGKYDKIKLQSIVDAVIITTDGFGIYKNKEKMELIRAFAETSGIIVLTDSDNAGRQIRNYIKGSIKNGKIYNLYIPDIFGVEKRKEKPSKEGKIGVEGINTEILKKAFLNLGILTEQKTDNKIITKLMLMEDGLIGGTNSAIIRKKLQKKINLPENLSANSLLEILNALYDLDKYKTVLEQIRKD